MSYETIHSPAQLSTLASKSSVVVLDFHATWCGPCKVIAPVFEQLAREHASPNKVAFAKVDVDAAQGVAQIYAVRAMPTFVILKNGKEADRIQGADRAALTAAVGRAVKDARKVMGFAGAGKGYTLGGSTAAGTAAPSRAAAAATRGGSAGWMGGAGGLNMDAVVRFVVLYAVSLFSFDAIKSAAECRFAVQTEAPGTQAGRRMGS